MAQTACLTYAAGDVIDYTPSSAVAAGEVVVVGNAPYIAPSAIEANTAGTLAVTGVWQVPKADETFTAGLDVYWDTDGSPYGGTASSGAATATGGGNYFLGTCAEAAANTATYVKVIKALPGGRWPRVPTYTVAAAGAAQGNAAALIEGFNLVTAADAAKGVILPAASAGLVVIVKNDESANAALLVYPNTADTINNGSANAALSMAANTCATFRAYDATEWFSEPKLPS